MKTIFNAFMLILGCDCTSRQRAVDAGIVDLSGQGRNKYGK